MLNQKTFTMENQDSEKLKNREDVRPSQALENLVKEKDSEVQHGFPGDEAIYW